MNIVRATNEHVGQVAGLFDLYRQFYACAPDAALARAFIAERIANAESTVFLALDDDQAAGFVQLYPSFCSVDAVKRLILYDLYVTAAWRRRGVAEALIKRATHFARDTGAARIDLETAIENIAAQTLYEKLGYERSNQGFYSYALALDS